MKKNYIFYVCWFQFAWPITHWAWDPQKECVIHQLKSIMQLNFTTFDKAANGLSPKKNEPPFRQDNTCISCICICQCISFLFEKIICNNLYEFNDTNSSSPSAFVSVSSVFPSGHLFLFLPACKLPSPPHSPSIPLSPRTLILACTCTLAPLLVWGFQ